ncbi:MAG: hypothetical protein NTV57_00915 [Cyanobacteria bacterium]|nr:hypothetical protein [Cyanobacteriota bacterium]
MSASSSAWPQRWAGSRQGADLLLEIPAELGALQAGTELGAQWLRLPIF